MFIEVKVQETFDGNIVVSEFREGSVNILVGSHSTTAKTLQAKVVDEATLLQCFSSRLNLFPCGPLHFTQIDLELVACSQYER